MIKQRNKIFCFGELLLRLSPDAEGNWLQQNSMLLFIGGAELNVATALANWNIPVKYCSALPNNYLSSSIIKYLQQKNIDPSAIHISGNRIGSYYIQQGKDLKNAAVIYDRAYSSFAELKPGMIDWDEVLQDVCWFHFSAISPALNENSAAVCLEGIKAATKNNITISVDLNYRPKLWQYEKKAIDVMPALVEYCNVVMGNIWSANSLLGIAVDEKAVDYKTCNEYLQHAKITSAALMKKFTNCKLVANTFRFDKNAAGIEYYTSLFSNDEQFNSSIYSSDNIINKIGSGDCFMAGLIYGMQQQFTPQQTAAYATAAAFGKMQETGDATAQTIEQVNFLIK